MLFETIIELSVRAVGGFVEITLMSYEPKSRAEKVQKQLESYQGKRVKIRTGEVLLGGKFRFDEVLDVEAFHSTLDGENLKLITNQELKTTITIQGKSISRFYTGKKSNARICINTNGVDYLIEDVMLQESLQK
ncbi:hypothetical protein ACFYKX_15545 [Cytobacillus sp. FJAT-54145]|uniref:Uncharacterized protein n=1 Tax=Cytobacillus spartinae TaxID=3299023 RepID=A0ABW6KCQ0_9BACI